MANNKRELRKLRPHVQMSIDGCIAGPNGEMDWMVELLDDELMREWISKVEYFMCDFTISELMMYTTLTGPPTS
jgi:hypothetical protein